MSRRALVTGGSGAIGAAICRRLARQGCEVIVHANAHLDAAKDVAEEIAGAGGKASAIAFDVADCDRPRARSSSRWWNRRRSTSW